MEINGVNIPKGKRTYLNLGIAKLPTRTEINLPVYVYRSEEEGPSVLVVAGIHGDELNGIEAIRRMIAGNMLMPEKGTVIAIPLLNIYGFLHHNRDLPDGKDINRVFPGSSTGSLAGRLAYHFMTKILPHADYVIDFHTGGARRSNYPQIRYSKDDPISRELAKAFNAHYTIGKQAMEKSFRKEAAKRGVPVVIYEAGESLRFDETSIQTAIDGTRRVMHFLNMVPAAPVPDYDTVFLEKTSWLRSKMSGLFRSYKKLGEPIKRRELLGSISDPYGESEVKIKAPHGGYIIGLNNLPVVNQGDALYHIGFSG